MALKSAKRHPPTFVIVAIPAQLSIPSVRTYKNTMVAIQVVNNLVCENSKNLVPRTQVRSSSLMFASRCLLLASIFAKFIVHRTCFFLTPLERNPNCVSVFSTLFVTSFRTFRNDLLTTSNDGYHVFSGFGNTYRLFFVCVFFIIVLFLYSSPSSANEFANVSKCWLCV